MELIERSGFLSALQSRFEKIKYGEGHCVFINGEAGIGKTSLVKTFCDSSQQQCRIFRGTCDALFTPRLLAPLYDIIWQLKPDIWKEGFDRNELFPRFFQELSTQEGGTIIVFEDIHWADEATLDFIKFFARRITQLHCLFILTYRDDEIHARNPLKNLLAQLSPDSFSRMQLVPLSKPAVETMAKQKGYNGEDVYSISGGNPFYVNEILASYSTGIPDNIKDSVLSSYNRQDGKTKYVWELLSVIPTGFEISYLEKIEPLYADAVKNCINSGILLSKDGMISFKHELYRRTIEHSLSYFLRIKLNKQILDLLCESFQENKELERIIHHAQQANEYELIAEYAPIAAKQAAAVGAHIEAGELYFTAIRHYKKNDPDKLAELYDQYAYECYLTNRIRQAIIYETKSLGIWKQKGDIEKTGSSLRFLSRLWWFDGDGRQSETYAIEAVKVLDDQPLSRAKAMAFSNMSQLKMHANDLEACNFWGEKAIAMAKELNDHEILSHALNNVGMLQMQIQSSAEKGISLLQQSLDLALEYGYHEHAARAYANMGCVGVKMKNYAFAEKKLEEGIKFCEERDLDSWKANMLSWKSRLQLETGRWTEAYEVADGIISQQDQSHITKIVALVVAAKIKMRRGEDGVLPLLDEARMMALRAMEMQRIVPVFTALLEYEWITGKEYIRDGDIELTIGLLERMNYFQSNDEFSFWLFKARQQALFLKKEGLILSAYERSLKLFEGTDENKREALLIIHKWGASAVYDKLKMEMRNSGIKKIPRGIRKATQSNPAFLTQRELDVLQLVKEGMQNKEIASKLFISAKTVDHHISSILFKLDVNSRVKAVQEAIQLNIIN